MMYHLEECEREVEPVGAPPMESYCEWPFIQYGAVDFSNDVTRIVNIMNQQKAKEPLLRIRAEKVGIFFARKSCLVQEQSCRTPTT